MIIRSVVKVWRKLMLNIMLNIIENIMGLNMMLIIVHYDRTGVNPDWCFMFHRADSMIIKIIGLSNKIYVIQDRNGTGWEEYDRAAKLAVKLLKIKQWT